MSHRLYYDDAYTRAFDAQVIETTTFKDRPAVVLDRTYFYPASGGQPNDTGTLNGIAVRDVVVREEDQAVIHILEHPLETGAVHAEIDWARRFDHMQHHTGQHILTQAFVQLADAHTVAFHLSADSVTIDLDKSIDQLEGAVTDKVEGLVNRIIQENRLVSAEIIDPAAAADVRMRKMPDHLLTDGLRIICVEDFDRTACGGTHVQRTGEIGLLKILRLERRGEQTRVAFCCGSRAFHDYDSKHRVTSQLASALTCHYTDVPDAVSRMQDDLKEAQRALKSLSNQLLEAEAQQLLDHAQQVGDLRVVMAVFEERDRGELQSLAARLAEQQGTIALLAAAGDKAHLVFSRHDALPQDMNTTLQAAFARLSGGRGGGRPSLAQGGGIPATRDQLTEVLNALVSEL